MTRALASPGGRSNGRSGPAEEEGNAVRLRLEERPAGPTEVVAEVGIGDVAREYQGVRSDGFEQRRQAQVPAERDQDAEEDLPVLLGGEGERGDREHQERGDAKAVEEPEELGVREQRSGGEG